MLVFHKQVTILLTTILAVTSVTAFVPLQSASMSSKKLFVAAPMPTDDEAVTYFDDLVRAVKAVKTFGLCDADELYTLADKVDAGADSCMFEVGQELCDKEIEDRKDVAEVLRMQAELQLRMDAIQGSSLFASDVEDESLILQRDELLEFLGEDAM